MRSCHLVSGWLFNRLNFEDMFFWMRQKKVHKYQDRKMPRLMLVGMVRRTQPGMSIMESKPSNLLDDNVSDHLHIFFLPLSRNHIQLNRHLAWRLHQHVHICTRRVNKTPGDFTSINICSKITRHFLLDPVILDHVGNSHHPETQTQLIPRKNTTPTPCLQTQVFPNLIPPTKSLHNHQPTLVHSLFKRVDLLWNDCGTI